MLVLIIMQYLLTMTDGTTNYWSIFYDYGEYMYTSLFLPCVYIYGDCISITHHCLPTNGALQRNLCLTLTRHGRKKRS